MPLRKIFKDKYGLYIRAENSIYRPPHNNSNITSFYLRTYPSFHMATLLVTSDRIAETWERHGPAKYENGKYYPSEKAFDPKCIV